ncbi:uncharacterized protein LOC115886744 isoform X2 [Sitophilus oryzae]|uniref:Uncharacterized protein LOC115886744 isoform X2 n=1 Tax=Sitophilus oryzae TaxID=7048 RepID=A0A6J2YFI1_SITOR|nr:uncharacterized protein LOC115886744 isoform X2 [Sitophilus oryzae]
MFVITPVKNYISKFFATAPKAIPAAEIGLMDVYLEEILKILSWNDPHSTLKAFCVFNIFALTVLTFDIKFYGIFFLVLSFIFVYDTRCREQLYAEYKGEYAYLVKEIKNGISKITDMLQCLHRDSPVMFTCFMVLFFLTMRIISLSMSGITLCMVLLFMPFCIPKGIQLLPEDTTEKLKYFLNSLSTPKNVLAEDELIPFIQGKDFSRREADLESLLTDRTADSVTNSFVSGITAMPSYMEIAGTEKDLEEEDLIPNRSSHNKMLKSELSSDSESDNKDIQFDSDHFNTSSSEEEHFSKGLAFPKEQKETEGLEKIISSVMSSVSENVLANILYSGIGREKQPAKKVRNSESDDSSDFEIIDYVSSEDD